MARDLFAPRLALALERAGRVSSTILSALLVTVLPEIASAVEPGRETRVPAEPCRGTPFVDALGERDGEGGFRLASGKRVRLVDLRWPDMDGARPAAAGLPRPDPLAILAPGARVHVTPAGAPNRWGDLPAALALGDGAAALDLGELLAAEGLAIVDPGERDALCRPDLLRLEASARSRRIGLWANPATAPLSALDLDAIRDRAGRFALVEGRVVSVGERRDRTYLNFGRDFARDFAVVLPKRAWAAMLRSGRTAASLRGRSVRVRGVVELRRGPAVEIAAADMVEVLDEAVRRP